MSSAAIPAPAGPRPARLRGRGVIDCGRVAGGAGLAAGAAAVALPFLPGVSFYYLQVGILVFWYAILGTSWTIAGGYGGLHSIGNATYVGVGAYTSTLLYADFGVTPWLGLLAGMALAALVAAGIGYPCFRAGIKGDYFALVTVALGQVAYEIANGATAVTKGSQGVVVPFSGTSLADFQFADRTQFYYAAMVMWLIAVVIAYRVRRSHFGLQLAAVRDDEVAAARGGISASRRKLAALALSAAVAAAAGTFYAQFFLFIDPSSVFGISLSVQIVLMAVLGGMNSYLGGTVGALILVPVSQYLATTFNAHPGVDVASYGAVLVVLTLYMPYGLLGLLRHSPRWRSVIGW
jgi:branched-chain amino acid transport system permease protein